MKLKPERIVLEPTGGYESGIVQVLLAAKLPVVVVNARQVRNFAQALGRLAKTDRIDADVLAHFGEAIRPDIRAFPDNDLLELEALVNRRRQLVDMRAGEVALVACMRKLLTILNAMKRDNRGWTPKLAAPVIK